MRSMEKLAVAIIVQAFFDLTDQIPRYGDSRDQKKRERERVASCRSAAAFLTGTGEMNKFGIEYWCDHIGLDPDYAKKWAVKIIDDPHYASEVRHRLSYLGSTKGQGSQLPPSRPVRQLAGEASATSGAFQEEA